MSLTASELDFLRDYGAPSVSVSASLPVPMLNRKQALPRQSASASGAPPMRGYVVASPSARVVEPPSHAGERMMLATAFKNGMRQFAATSKTYAMQSAAELATGYVETHNLTRHPDYIKLHLALRAGFDEIIRPAFAEYLMAYIHKRFEGRGASRSSYERDGVDIQVAQGIYSLLMSKSASKMSTQSIINLAFALLPELSQTQNWFGAVVDRVVMLTGASQTQEQRSVYRNSLNKLYEIDTMTIV
jgi:hypothetical protein